MNKTKPPHIIIKVLLVVQILIFTSCSGQINAKRTTELNHLSEISTQNDSIDYNQYKDGKKDGLWREFDENDQLISEGYYTEGKANGLMKWYWKGNLVAYGDMKNDKRHGLWKICDFEIQSNCIEANFNKDKKVGTWKILHENGKLAQEQYYNDGKLVSKKCWDENGAEIKCK